MPMMGDLILTSILFGEVILVLSMLCKDMEMLVIFIVSVLLVGVLVKVTKVVFRYLGTFLCHRVLTQLGNPLRKKKTMKKWCDQSWQLVIHTSMAVMEYNILKHETWWTDTSSMWKMDEASGYCRYTEGRFLVKLFYILQLGIWMYTAFSCKYLEELRKDYLVMMTHHVVTIGLVAGSYMGGYMPIGVAVLFLHDLSDVPLDLLKMMNYIQLEGYRGMFLTEIMFIVVLVDWYYFRVYLYPVKLLYSVVVQAQVECPIANDASYWNPDTIPGWLLLTSMLSLLWLLHLWWAWLIMRLLIGILTKGSHQAAEDEYEGESSESEAENKRNKNK